MLTSFKVRTLKFQLMTASRDTEAELVCVDSYGKKSGMGVLSGGGFMFTVPLNLIRKLLNKVGTTNIGIRLPAPRLPETSSYSRTFSMVTKW